MGVGTNAVWGFEFDHNSFSLSCAGAWRWAIHWQARARGGGEPTLGPQQGHGPVGGWPPSTSNRKSNVILSVGVKKQTAPSIKYALSHHRAGQCTHIVPALNPRKTQPFCDCQTSAKKSDVGASARTASSFRREVRPLSRCRRCPLSGAERRRSTCARRRESGSVRAQHDRCVPFGCLHTLSLILR
ncbi:hypothetical protein EDB85DRAFT_94258 [Lactarius pseudohatsudake]|nr:hypothetical protein EDB85DRAFT_94258 [Lactarius pseudohatsudake]